MPIDPQNPNDPNIPDLSKLLNFEDVRKNIDQFFGELLSQLQGAEPEVKNLFSGMEASGKKAFDSIAKAGETAFDKVGNAASKAMDSYKTKAKEVFESSGFKKLEVDMLSAQQRVTAAIEKEDKERFETEMKFLKATLSKEEYAIQEIMHERDELLQHIEDEYILKRNLLAGEIKDEQAKTAEFIKLDKERETKKDALRKSMALKERKARGEDSPLMGKVLGVLRPSEIGKRAQADIAGTLTKTLEKFSSFAFILGGVSAVLLKLFGAAQSLLIREGKQAQISFNVANKLGSTVGERAFSNIENILNNLGIADDEVQKYLTTLGDAPAVLKDIAENGASSFAKLTYRLGAMGLSAEETTQLISKASQEWGMSIEDLMAIQQRANGFTKITGLTTAQTLNSFINLNAQLRRVSASTRDAATLMALTGQKPGSFGGAEFQRYQGKLADIISGKSFQDLIGMFQFTKDRFPTLEQQKAFADPRTGAETSTKVFFDFLVKALQGLGATDLTKPETLAGLETLVPGLDRRETSLLLENLQKYIQSGTPDQSVVDAFVKQNAMADNEAKKLEEQGRQNLQKQVEVTDHLSVAIENLFNAIASEAGLTKGVWSLVRMIQKIPGMGGSQEAHALRRATSYDSSQLNKARRSGTRKNVPMRSYEAIPTASYDPETGQILGGNVAVRYRNTGESSDPLAGDRWKSF